MRRTEQFAWTLAALAVGGLLYVGLRNTDAETGPARPAQEDTAGIEELSNRVARLERMLGAPREIAAASSTVERIPAPPPSVFRSPPEATVTPAVPGAVSDFSDQPRQEEMAGAPADPLENPLALPNPAEVAGQLLDKYNALADAPESDKAGVAALREISKRQVVAQLKSQPRNSNISCRSNVCRFAGTFANSTDAETWKTVLLASMGSEFPRAESIVVPNDDGTAMLWIYAARR